MVLDSEENNKIYNISFDKVNRKLAKRSYTDLLSELLPLMKDVRFDFRFERDSQKQQIMIYGFNTFIQAMLGFRD